MIFPSSFGSFTRSLRTAWAVLRNGTTQAGLARALGVQSDTFEQATRGGALKSVSTQELARACLKLREMAWLEPLLPAVTGQSLTAARRALLKSGLARVEALSGNFCLLQDIRLSNFAQAHAHTARREPQQAQHMRAGARVMGEKADTLAAELSVLSRSLGA